MKSNPENTPFMREVRKHEKAGKSEHEAWSLAWEKWPDRRNVVCYVSQREHRTAATNLAKALIKQGTVIDYHYYSQKEMRGETGDPDASARFEFVMKDSTTPFPWDQVQQHWEALGMEGGFLDCYDDDFKGTYGNPDKLKAKLLR